MATLRRLERWSELVSDSGARVSFCVRADMISAEEYLEVNGREELLLRLNPRHGWMTDLLNGDVLRVVYDDGDWDEYRVAILRRGRRKDGSLNFEVLARSPKFDLARRMAIFAQADGTVFLHHELAELTPSDYLTALAASPYWPSHFTVGTVDPTTKQTFVMDWETLLSALDEAAVIAGAEVSVERNGTSGYTVKLLSATNSTQTADIRLGKNALEFQVEEEDAEFGTWIYPRGEGPQGARPTVADLKWLAVPRAAEPTTLWTLFMWNGSEDASGDYVAMAEDDQLNGLYLEGPDGTTHLIDDSEYLFIIADNEFRVNVTLSAAASDLDDGLCALRMNAAGDELVHIPVPSAVALYGEKALIYDREDIPDVTNLVSKPFELGAEITDYTKLGVATITTVAAPDEKVHYGDELIKVEAFGEDSGIRKWITSEQRQIFYETMVTEKRPYLSFQVAGFLESGSVKLQVQFYWTLGFHTIDILTIPFGVNSDGSPIEAKALAAGRPFHITIEPQSYNWYEQFQVAPPLMMSMNLTSAGGTSVFYVDAFQCVNRVVAADKIVSGSSSGKLWDATMRAIRDEGLAEPRTRLRTAALDRKRLDAAVFLYDDIVPGATATLTDPGLNLSATRRISSVRRDLLREALTRIELEQPDAS